MPVVCKSSGYRSSGIVGRVFGTIFFGAFLAAGLFFLAMMARDVGKSLRLWFWTKTDCVIMASEVRERAGDSLENWYAEISYHYDDPQTDITKTSSQVSARGIDGSKAFEDAGTAPHKAA